MSWKTVRAADSLPGLSAPIMDPSTLWEAATRWLNTATRVIATDSVVASRWNNRGVPVDILLRPLGAVKGWLNDGSGAFTAEVHVATQWISEGGSVALLCSASDCDYARLRYDYDRLYTAIVDMVTLRMSLAFRGGAEHSQFDSIETSSGIVTLDRAGIPAVDVVLGIVDEERQWLHDLSEEEEAAQENY